RAKAAHHTTAVAEGKTARVSGHLTAVIDVPTHAGYASTEGAQITHGPTAVAEGVACGRRRRRVGTPGDLTAGVDTECGTVGSAECPQVRHGKRSVSACCQGKESDQR